MAFGMFSNQSSPIAIDFGSSSIKLLQLQGGEDRPQIIAAAEVPVPDHLRNDQDKLLAYYAEYLPAAIKSGRFKGKRVVSAVPSGQTFIQHMQLSGVDNSNRDSLVSAQLQTQMGVLPGNIVVRAYEVADVNRTGTPQKEVICFAVSRETVMRYIEMLNKCKLEVVGMQTEILAMIGAFDHVTRRDSDSAVTTLYVDLGHTGMRIAITHGRSIVFARYVAVGGRQFDQHIASGLNCDTATARTHRLALSKPEDIDTRTAVQPASTASNAAGILGVALGRRAMKNGAAATDSATATLEQDRRGSAVAPALRVKFEPGETISTGKIDLREMMETVSDEISMSLRYHNGLFPKRRIDRVIFLGGESRQPWLCQHVATRLRLPAQLGDPIARYQIDPALKSPALTPGKPHPGWAVASGLCTAPTDL